MRSLPLLPRPRSAVRCIVSSYNGRVETADVIVGGAGIIGLTVALDLARNGYNVRVIEKGHAMTEASWAAAGMLSAHDPEHPAELAPLAALSISLYPEYLSLIEQLSGHRVRLRTRATVVTNRNGDEFPFRANSACHALSAQDAEGRIPGLVTKGRSFFLMEEASLDPRDLCVALPEAAIAAGVTLQQETEVLAVSNQESAVKVVTQRGAVNAGAFVNCCGAWAARVRHPGLQCQPAAAVEPWKGQMLTVRLPAPLDLSYVLRTPEVYLVPRGEGLIVIGATVERAGFDRRVDPATMERLRTLAAALWPPLASAPVVESWSGLRPGTSDGLPLIGSAGIAHCWIATGHFRNGILLAPATGLVVRQLMQGRTPEVPLAAFVPGRSHLSAGSENAAAK
jgi:glycine oxidase